MADNILVTPGSGASIATDDVGGVHYQRSKIMLGAEGIATADLDGTASRGAYVDVRGKLSRIQITPVIDTAAYATGDCLGPLQTVSNAARISGGGGHIVGVQIVDKTQAQRAAIDLVFFSQTVTTAANNALFTISDADALFMVAYIAVATGDYNTAWPGTPTNSVAVIPKSASLRVPYVCATTSLFMQAIVRGTPTYTSTSDIVIGLTVEPD